MQESCSEAGLRPMAELQEGTSPEDPVQRKASSRKGKSPWMAWPSDSKAEIPILSEHPCLDRTWGLERIDGRWKDSLSLSIERGRIRIPSGTRNRKRILRSIDDVTLRTYHAARMLQTYFENPSHGNFRDPFLESMYIMLSWRTRIPDAEARLREVILAFKSPRDLAKRDALPRLRSIVGRSGFAEKRPEMIVELVRRFMKRFPDGNTSVMACWKDDEIIEFLTGIPGIGRKSALCVMMYSLGKTRFPIDTHVGRVIKRTQILHELVLVKEDTNHKVLQAEAEFAVPPSVRRALHTGSVALGQRICRPSNPSCGKCPISGICQFNRQRLLKRAESAPFSHVDLFCGAGGFSEGFNREGFRTVLAVDCEPSACDTFRMNHPSMPEGNVLCEDLALRQVKSVVKRCDGWNGQFKRGHVDVLTAGIPCQGFSKAGYRSRPGMKYDPLEDPRNLLYKRVLLWIRDLEPRYVILENVPEIRSAGGKDVRILDSICGALRRMEYRVDHQVINAFDHGTPQIRLRMIILASLRSAPEIKLDELEEYSHSGMTVRETFAGLPPLKSNSGSWYLRHGDALLTSHVTRFNNEEDLRIFEALRPGEHYEQFIIRRRDIIEDRRKSRKRAVYGTRSFSDKYHKLDAEKPARTIVAHLKKDGNGYIHPSEPRSISIREAMRIQGFRDDYVFCGSGAKQYIQVGNAVPPPLSRDIARLLADHLEHASRRRPSRSP